MGLITPEGGWKAIQPSTNEVEPSVPQRLDARPVYEAPVRQPERQSFVKALSKVFFWGVVALSCLFFVLFIGGIGVAALFSNSGQQQIPTSTPSVSRETHRIGDVLRVGYWTYRVDGFQWADSLSYGSMGETADAHFLIVHLTIQNEDRTESTFPPVILTDDQGREFKASSKGLFVHDSLDFLKDVNPGVTSRGVLVFDVPSGEYSIRLSGGYESEDTALVTLRDPDTSENPSPATPAVPPATPAMQQDIPRMRVSPACKKLNLQVDMSETSLLNNPTYQEIKSWYLGYNIWAHEVTVDGCHVTYNAQHDVITSVSYPQDG